MRKIIKNSLASNGTWICMFNIDLCTKNAFKFLNAIVRFQKELDKKKDWYQDATLKSIIRIKANIVKARGIYFMRSLPENVNVSKVDKPQLIATLAMMEVELNKITLIEQSVRYFELFENKYASVIFMLNLDDIFSSM